MVIKIKPDAFKHARIKSGFSQRGLGRETNLSGTMINQIEKDERNPSPNSAKRICHALNVTFDDIFFVESVCSSKHKSRNIV